MGRAVIRLGDYTSHGGRVITASARFTIDGIPVALWGDHCSCPIPGHDNCVICEGEVNAMFDGRPVALEGHKTTCGCTLIASQHDRCNVSPLVKSAPATKAISQASGSVKKSSSAVSWATDSSAAVEALRAQGMVAHSAEEVRKAYTKAYKFWWENRPEKFRKWGPISNAEGWWLEKPNPVCVDYAEAASKFMNESVNLPGTGAFPKWDTEEPTDTLGVFKKTAPAGSHCNIHVYMTNQDGKIAEVVTFDPWWKP